MASVKKNGYEYTVKIVSGRDHLDSIYFGNLLIEVLGPLRKPGYGIAGVDVRVVKEFEYVAMILPLQDGLGGEFYGQLLVKMLEGVQDRGYGVASFTVEKDGVALSAGPVKEPKPSKAPGSTDPRESWTDLV